MYPFRGLGISCGTLVPESVPVQMDLFGSAEKQARMEQLERSVDMLRSRFGNNIVQTLSDVQMRMIRSDKAVTSRNVENKTLEV